MKFKRGKETTEIHQSKGEGAFDRRDTWPRGFSPRRGWTKWPAESDRGCLTGGGAFDLDSPYSARTAVRSTTTPVSTN